MVRTLIYILHQFNSIYINLQYPPIIKHCQKRRGNPPHKKKKGPVWSCQGAYTNIQTQNPKGHPSHSAVAEEGIVGLENTGVQLDKFGEHLRPPKNF